MFMPVPPSHGEYTHLLDGYNKRIAALWRIPMKDPRVAKLADVPSDDMRRMKTLWWHPVHSEVRVKKTKWVVLRYPTPSMAQMAGMSTEAFEDFYFDVCTFDYAKLGPAIEPLKALMDRTDR